MTKKEESAWKGVQMSSENREKQDYRWQKKKKAHEKVSKCHLKTEKRRITDDKKEESTWKGD